MDIMAARYHGTESEDMPSWADNLGALTAVAKTINPGIGSVIGLANNVRTG